MSVKCQLDQSTCSSCLFCGTYTHLPPLAGEPRKRITFVNEDGEPIEVKLEGEGDTDVDGKEGPGAGDSESGSFILPDQDDDERKGAAATEDDSPIRDDLRAIFIVRKVLDLPEDKCEEYLQREKEGYPSPGSWFGVCVKCNGVVKECYQAYQQIGTLERSLRRMKEGLKDLIRDTIHTSDVRKHGLGRGDLVSDDVRTCAISIAATFKIPATERMKIMKGKRKLGGLPQTSTWTIDQKRSSRNFTTETVYSNTGNMAEGEAPQSHDVDDDISKSSDVNSPDSTGTREGVEDDDDPDWDHFAGDKEDEKEKDNSGDLGPSAGLGMTASLSSDKSPLSWSNLVKRKTKKRGPRRSYHRKCSECPAIYWNLETLRKHQNLHITNGGVKCPECDWLFEGDRFLLLHICRRHPDSRSKLVREGKLRKKRESRLRYRFKCKKCPAVYWDSGTGKEHQNLHTNHSGVKCPACGWLVRDKTRLSYHIWKHHPESEAKYKELPYYCDHCQMIFTTVYTIQKHHNAHHLDMPQHSCQKCQAGFISKQLLELHVESDHPDLITKDPLEAAPEEELHCEHCSETFGSKLQLDYHIAKIHPSSLLKCRLCDYHPKKYYELDRHMKGRHENSKVICELCSSELLNKYTLKSHMRIFHYKELGVDTTKCPFCERVFAVASTLETHIQRVHHKVKDHFCEYCGKGFTSQGCLNKHLLIHTAPKELQSNYKKGPFICEHCPSGTATFNVRQGLYYHMKKAHSDKYVFHCGKCGMGYALETSLTHHEKGCRGKGKAKRVQKWKSASPEEAHPPTPPPPLASS